ncbi:DUF6069 family protein [Yinghuangia sp. YIM S09857]|uniref:DUF6069 family protein n=1 Tax=Yinghuangia sp. YIM S09857 TaxID=3436929 RepID=UPI003F534790
MATTVNTQAAVGTSRRITATAGTDAGTRTQTAVGPVWKVASLASLGGLAVAGIYEAIVRAAGVSFDMGASAADSKPVPAGGFVGFTVMFAVAGILFALALARWAKRPGRTYAVTAWAVVAASLALPFLPPYMDGDTRVVLVISHLVVAAAVVPVVAKRLDRITR